ncbi:MAG: ABC-type transport auxiliary lipoprotein family protein [Pseudomonadota bacterium]
MRFALVLLTTCVLLGCSTPDQFIASPKIVAQDRTASGFASIEVTEISLPAYAAREEIAATQDGVLVLSDTLWADDPTRSMTLSLARHLSELTGARVASEPWPFEGFAQARVEVRVEDLIVDGPALRLSGQYFVVDLDGLGRDHAHQFDLSTPLADTSAPAVARARAQALLALATEIAKDGL